MTPVDLEGPRCGHGTRQHTLMILPLVKVNLGSNMNDAIIRTLADTPTDRAGGKAAGLRRLIEAQLPVPPTYCLCTDVYRHALNEQRFPPRDIATVDARKASATLIKHLRSWQPTGQTRKHLGQVVALLGQPLIARSSATCEDRPGRSYAGIFESIAQVCTTQQLIAATIRCWESLWHTVAWAVLSQYDSWPGEHAMAVVVQPQLCAHVAGLARSRAFHCPTQMQIEAVVGQAGKLNAGEVDPESIALPRAGRIDRNLGSLSSATLSKLRDLVLTSEKAFDGPVEVEWLVDNAGKLWVLQARLTRTTIQWQQSNAVLESVWPGTWRWDREHNPQALSPAHESLIGLVDAASDISRLRVHRGYLYEKQQTAPLSAPPDPRDARLQNSAARLAQLDNILARSQKLLHTWGDEGIDPASYIQQAVTVFVDFCHVYSASASLGKPSALDQLVALLAQKLPVEQALETAICSSLGGVHTLLKSMRQLRQLAAHDKRCGQWLKGEYPESPPAIKAFIEQFGALSPVWDVASATFGESPQQLRTWLQHVTQTPVTPPGSIKRSTSCSAYEKQLIRHAQAERIAREEDDLRFAHAMLCMRRTLLHAGHLLYARGQLRDANDVFGLDVGRVRHGCASDENLTSVAQMGLQRWQQNRRYTPPPLLVDGRPQWPGSQHPTACLRGHGVGGTATGSVLLADHPENLVGQDLSGCVLVCPTLIPSLAIVMPQLAALVTDHGSVLAHGALLAREFGIPAVVGTQRASRSLTHGQAVWVDGERGLVCIVPTGRNVVQ